MAREKEADVKPEPADIKTALVEAIKALPPEELRAILMGAGAVPTTMGMDQATLQTIVQAFQATSATAVRETLRQERKENPNFPDRSAFNPVGVFDDLGNPKPPKVKFRRGTYFNHVRLGGELEYPEEIERFNRFTTDRSARDGRWTATIENKGTSRERLYVKVPSFTTDDRMENSIPLTLILDELLDGTEAVNPESLQKQIKALQDQVSALSKGAAA